MRNIDLEKFYNKIDASIRLVAAYMEKDYLYDIIKRCRLKPHSAFFKGFDIENSKFENHWVDEFGYSLHIKNKEYSISFNKNVLISSDLFYGLSILNMIKISKRILIKDNIACFIGEDEYFRAFSFEDRWKRTSALIVGIDDLKDFMRCKIGKNILDVQEIKKELNEKR